MPSRHTDNTFARACYATSRLLLRALAATEEFDRPGKRPDNQAQMRPGCSQPIRFMERLAVYCLTLCLTVATTVASAHLHPPSHEVRVSGHCAVCDMAAGVSSATLISAPLFVLAVLEATDPFLFNTIVRSQPHRFIDIRPPPFRMSPNN